MIHRTGIFTYIYHKLMINVVYTIYYSKYLPYIYLYTFTIHLQYLHLLLVNLAVPFGAYMVYMPRSHLSDQMLDGVYKVDP